MRNPAAQEASPVAAQEASPVAVREAPVVLAAAARAANAKPNRPCRKALQ